MAKAGPTGSLEQAFAEAAGLYQQGRLDAAEKALLGIQDRHPGTPDVLHLLALIQLKTGRAGEAVGHLEKAVAAEPASAELYGLLGDALKREGRLDDAVSAYQKALSLDAEVAGNHYNLGNALRDLNRPEDAVPHYRLAVSLAPDFADAHFNLGVVLKAGGHPEDAAAAYRDAIGANPDDAEAHMNLGNILIDLDDAPGALDAYQRAVALNPELAQAHYNLGNLLQKADQTGDAIACFRRALAIEPDSAETHNNLCEALLAMGDSAGALEHGFVALELDPGLAPAHNNIGNARRKLGEPETAVECYRRALEIDPDYVEAMSNLGITLMDLDRYDEAMAHHRRAVQVQPDYADGHYHLSLALLSQGRLKEGWDEYEWRWQAKNRERQRDFPQPLWQGESLKGKTILVCAEQGVGDEVIYSGQVPDLIDDAAAVVLECDPRLVPLFERSFEGVECLPKEDPPVAAARRPDIDYQSPGGSLNRWLRPDVASFPGRPSYLVADGEKRDVLRRRYLKDGGDFLVGISWISKNPDIGEAKSMLLKDWRPLMEIPGLTFVDLQYGDTEAERRDFEKDTGLALHHDPDIDPLLDLDSFAAQVAAMDLVISVSNTTVHMAGALGVPTWVMLNTAPLSCWLKDGETSHLYPSVKLLRQSSPGEWADVIVSAGLRLRHLAEAADEKDGR